MTILCTTSSFAAATPPNLTVIKNPFNRRLTDAEAAALIEEYQPVGIIAGVEPLSRQVLQAADGLLVISRCGIGLDNVDMDAARELGIIVLNTPEAPVHSVAELTVGLVLSLLRKIPEADRAVRQGAWPRLGGGILHGKTVGIIGCGRIGSEVAALMAAFGCTLLGNDPLIESHSLMRMVPLNDLLSDADVVSLHAPLVESTRRMINAETLAQMKSTAILVNTARGALVNEHDLVPALREKVIAGAALDVFEDEPYTGPLTTMADRTVLTCHLAASANEAREAMENEAVTNLIAGLAQQKVYEPVGLSISESLKGIPKACVNR